MNRKGSAAREDRILLVVGREAGFAGLRQALHEMNVAGKPAVDSVMTD